MQEPHADFPPYCIPRLGPLVLLGLFCAWITGCPGSDSISDDSTVESSESGSLDTSTSSAGGEGGEGGEGGTEGGSEGGTESGSETEGGEDPECAAPSGGLMAHCDMEDPSCEVGLCFIAPAQNGQFTGYCSPACESDADCHWGSEGQCVDEELVCTTPSGSGQARCVLPCRVDADCYPDQSCHPLTNFCIPDEAD